MSKNEVRWLIADFRNRDFHFSLDDAGKPCIEPLAKLTPMQRKVLKENGAAIRAELVREQEEIDRKLREWVKNAG